MHSSRMRTARLLPVSPSMHCWGGGSAPCGAVAGPGGGCAQGGSGPRGSAPGGGLVLGGSAPGGSGLVLGGVYPSMH